MNIHNSYFSIPNPLLVIDGWLHPFSHKVDTEYQDKKLLVRWTKRAEQQIQKRASPLFVEMQIYFTCVVQKRVLFHDHLEHDTQAVNDKLNITLRPVQAESCDPIEFANNHPVSHEYTSIAAKRFRPSELKIDFKNDQWSGEFSI